MTRRRTVAGLLALAGITGALVFGGAIVANAVPDSIVFTNPSPLNTTASDPTITGTVDWGPAGTSGGEVTLYVVLPDGTPGYFAPCDVLPTVTDTDWSCSISLPYGNTSIRPYVEAYDDPGFTMSSLSPLQVYVGGTAPVTITTPVPGDAQTTTSPVFSGTGPEMGSVRVEARPEAATTAPFDEVCVASVDRFGDWSCPTSSFPGYDDYTVRATGLTNTNIAVGGSAEQNLTLYAPLPPSLTLDHPTDGQVYTWQAGNFALIDGRTPDLGLAVDVELDGDPFAPCTGLMPDATTGYWTCGNVALPIGQYTISAHQSVDEPSAAVDVQVPAPAVSGEPLTGMTESTYRARGTSALTGYQVHAWVTDGEAYADCYDDTFTSGAWSCDLDLWGFAPGPYYTLYVEQRPFPEDTSINSVTGYYPFEVTAYSAGTPVPLNCSFTPAGATISSPVGFVEKGAYFLTPYDGSGESSGSSGSSGEGEGYPLTNQGYCGGDPGYVPAEGSLWNDELVVDCDFGTCSMSDLQPGLYEVWYQLDSDHSVDGYSHEAFDYVFRVPESPVPTVVSSTESSVLMRGSGTVGDLVRVVRPSGGTLCSTTVTASGNWACSFGKSTTSSARVIAVDPSSGGISARSAARTIPVLAETKSLGPKADEDAALKLVNWFLEFGGDLSNLKPGDKFTLNVSGMPVGTEIEVWIHSTPRLLGTATGTGLPMALDLQVPEDIESGDHEIEMIAVTPLGTNYFFTSDATVIGGAEPTKPLDPAAKDADSGDGLGGSGGAADRTDPAAPSGITGTMAPLQQIIANPATIAIAGGLALALLFLVALPTELLNSSLSSNTSRLGRVYGAVDGAMTKAQDWLIKVTHSRAIVAILLVVVVAFIYGFVDPGFGFDIVSVRLVLSLAIAFFILSFVASWISAMIVRRAWGASGYIALQPSIILFAVVGVVVARILDFSPGFLVGLAIGLELLQATRRVAARAVFVQIAVVVGLALLAWVGYSLFTPGDDFLGMLTEDMLVALTAEGLTGALIAVFPLHFLDGRQLWEVSKRLWVGAFLLVGVAFSLLVLPTAINGTDVRDYATWLIVFGVFAVVSLAIWFVFVRAARRAEPAAEAEHEKVDA